MNVELKSIDLSVRNSEETPCYSAKVYVDGKHVAHVRNNGCGGSDLLHLVPGTPYKSSMELNDAMDAHFAEDGDTFMAFEVWCHTQAWDNHKKKKLRAKLSRKVMFRKPDGHVYEFVGPKSEWLVDQAVEKYGASNVLNKMSFDDAWAIMRAQAE